MFDLMKTTLSHAAIAFLVNAMNLFSNTIFTVAKSLDLSTQSVSSDTTQTLVKSSDGNGSLNGILSIEKSEILLLVCAASGAVHLLSVFIGLVRFIWKHCSKPAVVTVGNKCESDILLNVSKWELDGTLIRLQGIAEKLASVSSTLEDTLSESLKEQSTKIKNALKKQSAVLAKLVNTLRGGVFRDAQYAQQSNDTIHCAQPRKTQPSAGENNSREAFTYAPQSDAPVYAKPYLPPRKVQSEVGEYSDEDVDSTFVTRSDTGEWQCPRQHNLTKSAKSGTRTNRDGGFLQQQRQDVLSGQKNSTGSATDGREESLIVDSRDDSPGVAPLKPPYFHVLPSQLEHLLRSMQSDKEVVGRQKNSHSKMIGTLNSNDNFLGKQRQNLLPSYNKNSHQPAQTLFFTSKQDKTNLPQTNRLRNVRR